MAIIPYVYQPHERNAPLSVQGGYTHIREHEAKWGYLIIKAMDEAQGAPGTLGTIGQVL